LRQNIATADQPVAELTDEQKRIRRRALAAAAVNLAMQSRWEEAVRVNREILAMFPDDPEASNRLGNALAELKRFSEAIEAYENTLRHDPTNVIAQRNLARLRQRSDAGEVAHKPSQKLGSAFFIEEVGKTGLAELQNVAPPEVIVQVSAGDEVKIQERDGRLEVTMLDGTYLGTLEPTLAARLIRLMKGGNRYQAGVVTAEDSIVRILIREVYQSPEQAGRISFPPRTGIEVRPYTRESLLRRGEEEEEESEEELSELDLEEETEEEENPAEYGFSETILPDEV
jgi:HAMP domain-containing protein